MRNPGLLLIVLICLLTGATAGAVRHPAGLMPVTITIKAHDNVYWLAQQGINIEELRGLTAEARLTQAQIGLLTAAGYAVAPRADAVVTDVQLAGYHTYTQVGAFLDSIHAAYPAITKKVSFGTTVQGRSLWAFLITDNPDSDENEAEVRLAANIHGDEVVGKELLLALIDSLTKTYGSNATIANYVNTREIWIVPCLNPDGLALSQRYNANGEDLNRDYPVPDGGSNYGSVSGTETETQQTMSYWGAKHTALSMVFHGGAVVANYPWDYTTTVCPDDALARAVALGYSQLNSPMYNSSEFPDGITNGADWYIVRGSLQDWSYNATGGLDITVECSGTKWPSASTLQGYWNDNKSSLLYFIRKAGEGIGGIVSDSTTGLPLNGVTVTVTGTGKAVTTDVPGDYHRMLTSGTYSVTFAKTGYNTKTISNVSVNFDNLTTLNVALKPAGAATPTLAISSTSWAPVAAGATSSAISVTNSGTTSVIAYTVASNQTWLTVSSAGGNTPGSFTMTAAANTGAARSATVTVTATTAGVTGSPKTIAVSQAAAVAGQNDAGTGADAGNDFATATLVSPGSWTGCYLDATDRNDYYKFSVTSGQVIKVKVTPPAAADFDLYLYNPSQTQVASATGGTGVIDSVVYTATVTGTFYAKAYEYSGTGNYSLLISVGGGTTPTTILAINTTSWAPVAAGGTSSAVSVTNSGTSGSVIAYTVASNQTWLTVSSASGNTPGSFTMTASANTGAARSATVTVAATGQTSKTIAVSQAAATGGDTYEPNGTVATAYGPLVSGTTYNSYIYSANEIDYYKLNVTTSGAITVTLQNLPGDYDLYLYSSDGTTQVGSSTASSTTNESISYSATAAGTYYVKVIGYNGVYSTTVAYALNATYPTGTPTPALAISSTSWAPAAAGATSSAVSVTNSGSTSVIAYTVADDATWLTTSAASGNTPGSFTMTATANTGTTSRSATVTVTAAGVAGSPKTIAVTQPAGGSGGTWTEVVATTQSAHPYANSYNYTWTITGPVGAAKMKVYFDSIKTETRYDSVFVLNSAGAVVQSFTGTYRAVWSGEVAGNVVKIKLKTDGSVTGFGFRTNKYSYYTAAAARSELLALGYPGEYTELLCQNRPNPVTNGTRISYNLPAARNVSLTVYNLNGQIVRTLVSGNQAAGHHTIEWDGKDVSGHFVSAGAYIYRLISGGISSVKRMTVIR